MRINANTRVFSWSHKSGGGSFSPSGRRTVVGDAALLSNPRRWEAEGDTFAARIIVGFRPKDAPADFRLTRSATDAIEDLVVGIVRDMRTGQVGDPGATFLSQRGLYKHAERGEVVDEPGMQVVLINTTGATAKQFERDAEDIAERLAVALDQEEVIVEIQKNGVTQTVFGVGQ